MALYNLAMADRKTVTKMTTANTELIEVVKTFTNQLGVTMITIQYITNTTGDNKLTTINKI